MEMNTSFEQTDSKPSLLASRWLWLLLVGLVLIFGGVWLIFSRMPTGNSSVFNDDTSSLEPAPIAGHPVPRKS